MKLLLFTQLWYDCFLTKSQLTMQLKRKQKQNISILFQDENSSTKFSFSFETEAHFSHFIRGNCKNNGGRLFFSFQ